MVKNKRIIVVDDSVIRGTTSRSRIRLLKDAGAKEVHLRVSCPPTKHGCYYGIDFPDSKDLIAATIRSRRSASTSASTPWAI
jgi:amidophosphoribosyltransferase